MVQSFTCIQTKGFVKCDPVKAKERVSGALGPSESKCRSIRAPGEDSRGEIRALDAICLKVTARRRSRSSASAIPSRPLSTERSWVANKSRFHSLCRSLRTRPCISTSAFKQSGPGRSGMPITLTVRNGAIVVSLDPSSWRVHCGLDGACLTKDRLAMLGSIGIRNGRIALLACALKRPFLARQEGLC